MKGKNFAGWVPAEYVAKAERLVRDQYGGNQSKFVAELVIAAVDGAPPSVKDSSSALLELARELHPTLVEELQPLLAKRGVNQKRAIARLLEAFAVALRDPEFDPSSEISLVDRKTREEWQGMSDARIVLAARELAAGLNEKGAEALLGARNAIEHDRAEKERAEELYRQARATVPIPPKQKKGPGKAAEA